MGEGKTKRSVWMKREIRILKVMSRDGKNNKEIAEVLGRTPGAIGFRKSKMKIKMKNPNIRTKKAKGVAAVAPVIPTVSTRDQAKDMARAARGIARANGKRITMAMFFVEDL
jgi:DNA-binding NarL/FixJ family response regulator